MNEAVNLLGASPTGNARCQITLMSDGMENSSLFWADVQAAVVATGCPVMSIAFGPDSNEVLMQNIAIATGGASYYNDVYVSLTESPEQDHEDTELDLGDTYVDALCKAQGCERLLSVRGVANDYLEVFTYTLNVDDSVHRLSAVLDWAPRFFGPTESPDQKYFLLGLVSPSGVQYGPEDYAFENDDAGYEGFNIDDPEVGEWKAVVLYLTEIPGWDFHVMAYGETDLAVNLLLPAVLEYTTGDYFPLFAIWMPGGMVTGTITAPDGTPSIVHLMDDGQHGDGAAGDGFFAGLYSLVTQAEVRQPVEEDEDGTPNPSPPAVDEGAYRIKLLATLGNLRRLSQGSFAVLEGDDSDGDGVPDDFIDQHCPGAPNSDADLDQLACADEYFTGTDPNNSDTDSGGESDESEAVRHGLDPLNPPDDLIEAFDFVQAAAQNGSVRLSYDVKGEYASILGYRATGPAGPWTLFESELSLSGTYTDTGVVNDTTYYYCLQAIDGEDHWSAVVCSQAVTPREDPVPPEGAVLINDGAATTDSPNVVLSFVPVGEEHETALGATQNAFDDITQVLISNDPSMAGAVWQPFQQQDIPWQLEFGQGLRTVYVRFMDAAGNESVSTATATIQLEGSMIFMPQVSNLATP